MATNTIYTKHPIYTNAMKKNSDEYLNTGYLYWEVRENRVELRGIEPLTS